DAFGTTINSRNIVGRLFDGITNTLGAPFTLSDHSEALYRPQIAALDNHRYAIVYADDDGTFGRIYDSSGAGSLSAESPTDRPNGLYSYRPKVATTADGGFLVAWQRLGSGNDLDIMARRYSSDGIAMGAAFTVNQLTDGNQDLPALAVSGTEAF